MRTLTPLVLSLALIPAVITSSMNVFRHKEMPYAGRGFVNPPTVYEMSQIKCLATMVYGEARGEAKQGMVAVAYTAVNRAVNKTVCAVVLAPKQYSIFNNNPALRIAAMSLHVQPTQKNIIDEAGWNTAMAVAEMVYLRKVPDPTDGSTHYLAPKVMASKKYKYPKWSKVYKLVATIDNHRFYKPFDRGQKVTLK